ncbi:MAG: DEAD/DEAH box helicase [Bdellovibrionota bacterium]
MYKLRPYQKESVLSAISHFKKSKDPAVLVLPTGSGKSLIIAELARIAKGRVLILTHVKELVEQNHAKYESYGLQAAIYSAGLKRKEHKNKVVFASVQSIARANRNILKDFSLLIVDECHRISLDENSQYMKLIECLRKLNPGLCIIGLTATPYRLGLGWIYEYHYKGCIKSRETRFFKKCIYEVSLLSMIKSGYLTQPVLIDAPVACYDFSDLKCNSSSGFFSLSEIEKVLSKQKRVTPGIIGHILKLSKERQGVMLFTSTVSHAKEILDLLPQENAALVVAETTLEERDRIVESFKARKIKFLVNVSVLTTGFDAPHVDVIAILRPTESIGLFQQIVGRGLRLSPGKEDCLILDYTGLGYDVYRPEVGLEKPSSDCEPVDVLCPKCGYQNIFWGKKDTEGFVVEHYGRKCQGALEDSTTLAITLCDYRFRFKICEQCGEENDIAARHCGRCKAIIVDADTKLRRAMELKDAHVMRPDTMLFAKTSDKKNRERLEISYYDLDAQCLKEYYYFSAAWERKAFYYNFARVHNKMPGHDIRWNSIDDVLNQVAKFRMPQFLIARKKNHFWTIREKIFLD